MRNSKLVEQSIALILLAAAILGFMAYSKFGTSGLVAYVVLVVGITLTLAWNALVPVETDKKLDSKAAQVESDEFRQLRERRDMLKIRMEIEQFETKLFPNPIES